MKDKTMFYGATPKLFELAAKLRENMTDAELHLWQHLRKSKLTVRFKAQHPVSIYIADFYCHKARLVIEVDGDIHKYNKEYDIGRTHELEELGLKVIRFTNDEVINNTNSVIETIRNEVKKRL